ncbi:hypothetical protein AVEN_129726-1 [Araneus ventricosus]|uniref:Uncharacterized protein n=1 Tax=Araneus ventricosus TaxID=182803 RepID=A0A4Y2DLA2_ARAVE|nr:hypothetical protein AVEN_129726-1 [Araneus ventricosus]
MAWSGPAKSYQKVPPRPSEAGPTKLSWDEVPMQKTPGTCYVETITRPKSSSYTSLNSWVCCAFNFSEILSFCLFSRGHFIKRKLRKERKKNSYTQKQHRKSDRN